MAFRIVFLLSLILAFAVATQPIEPAEEKDGLVALPKGLRMVRGWQLRALRRARARLRALLKELANLETASRCKITRRRKLNAILIKLRLARACRYRRLSSREYARLRALCKDRSEISDEITAFSRKCSRKRRRRGRRCSIRKLNLLKKKLKLAFEACRTIGWRGDGRIGRRGCPNILVLKKDLRKVEAIRCGNVFTRNKLLREIRRTKRRIVYLLRLIRPVPSARPRRIWK